MSKTYAYITGGTSGIGLAYALAFAQQGYNLILITKTTDPSHRFLQQRIKQRYGIKVHIYDLDLTSSQGVTKAKQLLKKYPVEILVNNAGFGLGATFQEANLHKEEDLLTLHCKVPLELTRTALPYMQEKNKGAIINIASFGGLIPMKKNAVYGGSKACLNIMMRSLALELHKTNISVLVVAPGLVKTHFHDAIKHGKENLAHHRFLSWSTPEKVVQRSLKALAKKKTFCIPSPRYRFLYWLYRHLPPRCTRLLFLRS